MLLRTLLFILAGTSMLHADIENHFKKIDDKSGPHHMRNIDFIYMINLDQRPEKFAQCEKNLTPFEIFPCRFSAVNGWELTLADINDVSVKFASWMNGGIVANYYELGKDGEPINLQEPIHVIGRSYVSHGVAPGAIGCSLSHLSILQDAYDSGYQTIWIMEDDIEIIRNPNILPQLIDNLDNLVSKDHWDILFTDRDTKNHHGQNVPCESYAWRPNFTPSDPTKCAIKQDISNDFRKIGARFGSYSMIVRRSGMKKILDFFKQNQIFLPYDMEYTLPPGINLFTVINDVVSTQPRSISDNGVPYYKKIQKNIELR